MGFAGGEVEVVELSALRVDTAVKQGRNVKANTHRHTSSEKVYMLNSAPMGEPTIVQMKEKARS